MWKWSEEYAEINPEDAARFELHNGETAKVISRRGEVTTKFKVTDRVPPGIVWMSFHYEKTPTNALTSAALDPVTKTGEYKVCAVKVEKI